MKKVLVFGMTENPGGIESVVMNYYRHIDRNVIQFDFLCNCSSIAYEDEIKFLGGKIYYITARKVNYFKFKAELKNFMQKHETEYSAIWVNVCSLINIDYLISAKKYRIPKRIIHCHNSSNDGGIIKFCIHQFNKKRLTRYATHFWSCSEDASPWFFDERIRQSANYKVIINGIDVQKYSSNQAIREQYREKLEIKDKVVIGHVGRFHFQKNHRLLIEIFEELSKRNNKYHLLLIGQGELEDDIKKIVNEKDLIQKVTFLGVRDDVDKLYQVMDVFLMPSLSEGLGIVALEAQAALLPCVLSDGIPQIVKFNDNVRYVSLKESVEVWADAVEEILKKQNPVNKVLASEYNIEAQVRLFEGELVE